MWASLVLASVVPFASKAGVITSLDKRSVERVRYVINNLLHLVIV